MESRDSSRRPSPEKRSASGKPREMKFARSSSPPLLANGKILAPPPLGPKGAKSRLLNRPKDSMNVPSRPSSSAGSKSSFRRPVGTPGGKVSNMAKHFERLGRDADRRKYNVIRGRRARPVATARARVEVLESVKDAINDESESSDSSSEADDEGDSNEEPTVADLIKQSESPEQESPKDKAPKTAPPVPETTSEVQEVQELLAPVPPPGAISLPPSPFLSSMRMEVSFTPPQSDIDTGAGTERNSILKALSGFWLQPPPASRSSIENEDLMNEGEVE
ncbi:hypothetical protein BDZ89DRAFT_1144873 [Hymenopellis radicata]|nr:hypothetical protein BDZ89DRAFT_1144873 [Hymenopellis radicata]